MAAYPQPPETIVPRPALIPERSPPPLHSRAPRQWLPRTAVASRVALLSAGLVNATSLVLTGPSVAFELSSQPPSLKCCNDRLNPPTGHPDRRGGRLEGL